jgi:hypothetical protein
MQPDHDVEAAQLLLQELEAPLITGATKRLLDLRCARDLALEALMLPDEPGQLDRGPVQTRVAVQSECHPPTL